MHSYRFKEGFRHTEKGERLEAGAVVTMSDRRYNSLKDRFELIEEPDKSSYSIDLASHAILSEPEPEQEPEDERDYSEWVEEMASFSAKQARKTAAVIDDMAILMALLEAESRPTVRASIEERIGELSE